jgi:hypothetical protein
MEIPRLDRQIHHTEDDLLAMTRSRDWHRYRYDQSVTFFKDNRIPIHWTRDAAPDKPAVEEDIPPPTKSEETKHAVLQDLNLNCDRAPCRHRYSQGTRRFASAAQVFSGACYRFLREFSSDPVNEIIEIFSRVDEGSHRMAESLRDYTEANLPLKCTLCIDAFSIDPTARANSRDSVPGTENNCFLFQLTPLDRRYWVMPLHLSLAVNGAASQTIRERVNEIKAPLDADGRIRICFVSVDGDEEYIKDFEAGFHRVLKFLDTQKLGPQFLIVIFERLWFWLSDWLHLLKNARAKLFGKEPFVNPQLSAREPA